MDDFEKYIEAKRKKERIEREKFFQKCSDKVNNGEDIYSLLGLGLCSRFKLKLEYDGKPPKVVWTLVNYYVNEVEEDWNSWLWGYDAPFIKSVEKIKAIFPELAKIYDDIEDIVNLANKLYGLEMKCSYDYYYNIEYVYAFSFDFSSFKPIDIESIKKLKSEREVLKKYGHDVSMLDKEISSFGLSDEELEMI